MDYGPHKEEKKGEFRIYLMWFDLITNLIYRFLIVAFNFLRFELK